MADEWNKDEKSIPAPPAGGAVPNASRADQNGKRVKWTSIPLLSSLVYGFATIVGYFYAKSYYGSFGIDILNYVAPIDLLLISIEQIENVAPFIFLVVPALLVWIIFGLPTLLLLTYVALVFLSLALFSIVLAVAAILVVVIAVVRILAPRLYWRWKALWATLADRVKRTGKGIKRIVRQHTKPQGSARDEGGSPIHADDDAEVSQKPVVFAVAYQEAMAQSHASKSLQEDRYFAAAKNIWGIFEQAWKEAWEWHRERLDKLFGKRKDGAPNVQRGSDGDVRTLVRLWQHFKQLWSKLVRPWAVFVFWMLLPIYVVGAASFSGRDDAKEIYKLAERDEQQTPNTLGNTKEQSVYHELFKFWTPIINPNGYLKAAFCIIVPENFCSTPILSETVYAVHAIPTGNLASLEFTDCADEERSNNKAQTNDKVKYVRANFRHDAGSNARRTTPDCLVYLGATGSMQFFVAYSEDSASEASSDSDIQSAPSVAVILNSGDRAASGPPPPPPPPDLETTPSFSVTVDGRSGAVSAQMCKLELKAVVGPFETGKSEDFEQDKKVRYCSIPGIPESTSLAPLKLEDDIKNITDGSDSNELLVLVGRADIRPINNSSNKSNMELAKKRAEWVQKQLSQDKEPHRNISVLSIVAGPSDTGVSDDPCSRVVEIYSCTIQGMEASVSDEHASDAEPRTAQSEQQPLSDSNGEV